MITFLYMTTDQSSLYFCLITQPGFEDGTALETPIVRYCAVSSIENSHRGPITDLLWIPDHYEVC